MCVELFQALSDAGTTIVYNGLLTTELAETLFRLALAVGLAAAKQSKTACVGFWPKLRRARLAGSAPLPICDKIL